MMQFTHWLKERRKLLDLTQADVAEKVGCSLVTIYKIEAGERRPSKQIADRLADCLGVAAEQREHFIRLARSVDPKMFDDHAPAPPTGDRAAADPAPNPFHLPIPPTRLIGRAAELDQIAAFLAAGSRRLITLLGPAGVGKTRLSLEIARACGAAFRDGACWLTLADINDPALVAPAIARALNIQEQPGQPLQDQLRAGLRQRELLLVLDNFEQVIAAAPLVGELLAACPRLAVLATSRIPLHVRGEQQFPLPPFMPPAAHDEADLALLAANQAVALFIERAQSINPRFALNDANAAAVAALCQRLDGLPLAIELVAVQSKFMTPQALLKRIRANALPVLKDGPIDLPARHQTLRQAFEWSYSLLPPPIRQVFAALGVFNGGWAAEAVVAVCPALDETSVEHAIRHLIESSLVQASWGDGALAPHFSLLETVRDYALEQLAAGDLGGPAGGAAVDGARERHAHHYCGQAEAAAPQLTGTGQSAAIAGLQRGMPNLRAALQWSLGAAPALAERLGAALWRFWWLCGYFTEGLGWLKQILALPMAAPAARALVFNGAGAISLELGDYAAARTFHLQALELRRGLGDRLGVAGSLGNLGNLTRQEGDYLAARAFYAESLDYFRELGNAWGVATTLLNLGTAAEGLEDYPAAQEYYLQSRGCYGELGDNHGLALALSNLGGVALILGDSELGARLCRQSLPLFLTVANYTGIALSFEAVARALVVQGQPLPAARLCGAASALREDYNAPIKPSYAAHYEQTLALIRERLDPAELADHWQQGRALDLTGAAALALRED